MARISKSEPLIFSLLQCVIRVLKISFQFSAPQNGNVDVADAIHRVSTAIVRVYIADESHLYDNRSYLYHGFITSSRLFSRLNYINLVTTTFNVVLR